MADAFRISIDASQVVDLAQAWQKAPETVAEEITRGVLEAELLLEREAKEGTPTATGLLRGSIAAQQPRRLADQIIGVVGTSLAYAVSVELGARPHFPPIQPLADWAHLKLGVSAEQAQHVGFLVARKIAARGTKGAFMFTRALQANTAQLQGIVAAAAGRIAARLAPGAAS
jgi:hypothetical protein